MISTLSFKTLGISLSFNQTLLKGSWQSLKEHASTSMSGVSLSLSGTIIRGTLMAPKSQLVTPISTKLQRPDGCD
jgi:hypothetical protein